MQLCDSRVWAEYAKDVKRVCEVKSTVNQVTEFVFVLNTAISFLKLYLPHILSFQFSFNNNNISILSFCRVLYVVCFLLGISPASEVQKPTFRNPLSVSSS